MIAFGSDHAGFALKNELIEFMKKNGYECRDYGTYTTDSCDYSDYAEAACAGVLSGECDFAILVCGTGAGISMSACKIPGIRAACCSDYFTAKYMRLHNNANALCLGARVVSAGLAEELAKVFAQTQFESGGRHERRVNKIKAIECKYSKEI